MAKDFWGVRLAMECMSFYGPTKCGIPVHYTTPFYNEFIRPNLDWPSD
jgi:hypothetical protein